MNDRTVNFNLSGQLLLGTDMLRLVHGPLGDVIRLPDGRSVRLTVGFEFTDPELLAFVELSDRDALVIGIEVTLVEQTIKESEL